MSQPQSIAMQLEHENSQIQRKISDLEVDIEQKKKLLEYYKRKLWHNELLISKQPKS